MSDNSASNAEVMRAIGNLEGEMRGVRTAVEQNNKKIDGMDERLRTQERKAATWGGGSGGIVAGLVVGLKMLISNGG